MPLYSIVPIKDLGQCKYGANVINKKYLNDEIVEYIRLYNVMPINIKTHKIAITEFYDTVNNVIVAIDPNDTRHYNYETVKNICDDEGVEFANQSFATVVKQMRKQFMDIQRATFSKEFRA